MTAILCIDSRNGLMFGGRRQSRDRIVLEDIKELCHGRSLLVSAYTNRLFCQYGFSFQQLDPNFPEHAVPGDCCFFEEISILTLMDKLNAIVLYQWNRAYPADIYFDDRILTNWTLTESKNFSGSSHETITRKVYKR